MPMLIEDKTVSGTGSLVAYYYHCTKNEVFD